jgi:hypothetical protein
MIRNNYAAARLQGLEEDLGLKGDQYQLGMYFQTNKKPQVINLLLRSFHPVRQLHSRSSTIQFVPQPPWSPIALSWIFHMRLGPRLRPYMLGQGLWRDCGMSICARSRGSTIFPWYVI